MKQHFSVTAMAGIQLVAGNTLRHQVDEAAWDIIKSKLGTLPLPAGWVRAYAERSLTIRSRTGAFTLKITLDKQVFVDRRLKNKDYKSDLLKHASIEEACEAAVNIISTQASLTLTLTPNHIPVTALQ